jgi:hypothetical protein
MSLLEILSTLPCVLLAFSFPLAFDLGLRRSFRFGGIVIWWSGVEGTEKKL